MRLIALMIVGMWVYAAAVPVPASGESTRLHALTSADDSRAWEAVGRVNLANNGFCTGTLIAPRIVLTAAHCMFEHTTGARISDATVSFVAGWRDGRAAAYRNARRVTIHPDYVYRGSDMIDYASHDLALIELDQPIRQRDIAPFPTGAAPEIGETVELVSYAMDREEVPSLEDKCRVLGRDAGLLVLSCDVNFGSSGAPVFVRTNTGFEIVSVISAKAEWRDRKVALGTIVAEPLADVLRAMRASGQLLHSATPAGAEGSNGIDSTGRSVIGAKFARP